MTATNVFVLDDATVARLTKWAAHAADGGWQVLCREIMRGRLHLGGAPPEVGPGLRAAIEALQALEVVEEQDEGAER